MMKNERLASRQRVRKAILLVSFLLFPITMNYFSPYVIIDGASQGILNGSLVTFSLMFLSSLFLGRLWCGWLCPVGCVQDFTTPVNPKGTNNRKLDWIKWLIWVPWIGIILWTVFQAGGYRAINLFLDTENGIAVAGSVDRPILYAYIIYYLVIALFLILSVILGRRAGCHTVCWMSPFMILGRKIRNIFGWPSLQLEATPEKCTGCRTCTDHCPMSLGVDVMVKNRKMETAECILCGSCVDGCPNRAIRYCFEVKK